MSRGRPRQIAFGATLLFSASLAVEAWGWGPAMHAREAVATLERLADADPEWAELANDDRLGPVYVRLGAIAPDFQWASEELTFGHSKALSYHLLDNAPHDEPHKRLFALGHLVHVAGDATAEVFVSPWVWAAHPMGIYDLFVGGDNAIGESETIMENFAELTLGTWDPLLDVLYDFYLGGEDARVRMDEILTWYCEQGRALAGGDNDCARVRDQILDRLAAADELLGDMPRDQAKRFIGDLLDKPPDDLIWLFTGGLLSSLIGSQVAPSIHEPWELRRFRDDVFADEAWWGFYEASFAELTPALTQGHLQLPEDARNTGWPEYTGGALAGGNQQSVMQLRPDRYAYGEGLIVDDLSWEGDAAVVRFFTAQPVRGTVRGVVRKDMPGFDPSSDAVVGEARIEIDLDPRAYASTPRSRLRIPFERDASGALGWYVELTLDGEDRPWFTSSWDALWGVEELALFWEVYRQSFGTYDGPFRSQRADGEPGARGVEDGALFVTARYDVADLPIPDALVAIDGGEPQRAGGNGVALFDRVTAGEHEILVTFPGTEIAERRTAQVAAAGETWVDVVLVATPIVDAPMRSDDGCAPLQWDPVLVGWPLATALFARLEGRDAEWKELPVVEEPMFCPHLRDEVTSIVELRIDFGADRSPEWARSGPVRFVPPPAPEETPDPPPPEPEEGAPEPQGENAIQEPSGDDHAPPPTEGGGTSTDAGSGGDGCAAARAVSLAPWRARR